MLSESLNEVIVVGSKMKIRLSKQNDGVDCGLGDDHGEEVIKKEVVQEQNYNQCPESDQSLKSGGDNLPLAQLSNSNPTGKRRKKPKEMHEDFCYQFKENRKKASASKSTPDVSNHAGNSTSYKREKAANIALHSPIQVKTPAMIRAEEVQLSLGSEFPSFTKLLVRSHVGSCFWMGLPMPFCKSHLPRKDFIMTLEDESGQLFEMKYFAEKTGLSAGWRKFAVGHQLLEGDVLIFQLVEPNKFKVYIVRANDLTEVDGALSLLNLDAVTKSSEAVNSEKEDAKNGKTNKKRKRPKSLPISIVQKKNKNKGLQSVPMPITTLEQFENESEEVGSEVLAGPSLSGSSVHFKDIKSFSKFNIVIDGLCIDSEIPDHIRIKYYELCCSKHTFIHARLIQGLNYKLVSGIICETVNIADAMRSCNLKTSRDEFESWDKTLKSFEIMGMDVGFLRARLCHLLNLAFESESGIKTRQYMEAKTERGRTQDEIKSLEAKLAELKEAFEKYGTDTEALRSKAESFEQKFQEEVDAPW
ncbi:hypothetical protein NMG60_11008123 [Bertholletia excelsa]